ncbi:hypothetical protein RRG08_034486 [Elysia crispata]|uniref:Uncharacterized protein n=1 Tax=Elysia crispata TaxID=231223 RepID=A0AAE1DGR0_9GAST|nr:hypothetical protein RRG08_034486 [Elysia crispata]
MGLCGFLANGMKHSGAKGAHKETQTNAGHRQDISETAAQKTVQALAFMLCRISCTERNLKREGCCTSLRNARP